MKIGQRVRVMSVPDGLSGDPVDLIEEFVLALSHHRPRSHAEGCEGNSRDRESDLYRRIEVGKS